MASSGAADRAREPWAVRLHNGAARVLLTVWIGSLWTIGYVVAPALFATLDDRSLAGSIAGNLFHIETRISVVCGVLLLALLWAGKGSREATTRCAWLVALMLALVVVSEWVVGPVLAEAVRGTREFAALHGVSALLYLATSLLGLALLLSWRPVSTAA
ncbi:MAG: DUF4149 domain-containing protein [Pseudomonadota bacterium]